MNKNSLNITSEGMDSNMIIIQRLSKVDNKFNKNTICENGNTKRNVNVKIAFNVEI